MHLLHSKSIQAAKVPLVKVPNIIVLLLAVKVHTLMTWMQQHIHVPTLHE